MSAWIRIDLSRMRSAACWLLLCALNCPAQQKPNPCQPGVGWFREQEGFTYNKIQVKKIKDIPPTEEERKKANPLDPFKPGSVQLEVTDGGATSTVNLSKKEWAVALSGCATGNIPNDIKERLGLPLSATVARGPAVMAAIDFDIDDLNGDGSNDHVKVVPLTPSLIVELGRSNGTLGPRVNYASGPSPSTVVLADFNGDGRPDAAVANGGDSGQSNGSVSVLIGNGDGTFLTPVQYAAGGKVSSLAVADFNADQRLDIAVTKQGAQGAPGSVSVLLGNGDGTFGAPASYPVGAGPVSVLAADLNGDQKPDLAVANGEGGSVSVLLGNGNGTFAAHVATAVGALPSYLGASDLNGDGSYDLVILHNASATLSVWFGQAGGTLRYSGRYLTGVDIGSFAILDYEDDPRPAVLAPDAAAKRLLYYGVNLDGTLTGAPAYLVGQGGESLAVADFNGDTQADIVVSGAGGPSVLLGRGRALFQEARLVPIDNALAGGFFPSVAAGDFNGDGKADLAIGHNQANRVSIQTGRGDGTFQAGVTLAGVTGPRFVAALDLNGDGRLDLAVVNEGQQNQGSVTVFLGNGNGTFQAPATYTTGPVSRSLASGDLNGDGRLDLVVVNQGGAARASLSILLGNATGTLQPAVNLDAGISAASAVIADFNGDGKLDVAFSALLENSPNFLFAVAVLPGNGNGTFQPRVVTKVDLATGALAAVDLDRDGNQDLVLAACCGTTDITRMLGNGDGTFRSENFAGGADPVALAAADFNKDGWLDLAVLDSAGGRTNGAVTILTGGPDFALSVSAASNRIGFIAPDSIVSSYGTGLANTTAVAPGPDWPETLAGTTVRVRDSEGAERSAQIYYAAPGQVSYRMPAGTAPGFALVTITSGAGLATQSVVRIAPLGPGLFFVNADRLAAALVVRVLENGKQVVEPVAQLNSQNQLGPIFIDLGPDGQQVVLMLFGTGIRRRASLSDVKVFIGGVEATVQYAGPQNEYLGLDQINVLIPKSLRGRNRASVVLTVAGAEANTVNIWIR